MSDAPKDTDNNQAARKAEALEKMKNHYVEVLMNQTTWSEDESREKLEANDYNVQKCVRLFMYASQSRDTNCKAKDS